jgi:hypothetical protein
MTIGTCWYLCSVKLRCYSCLWLWRGTLIYMLDNGITFTLHECKVFNSILLSKHGRPILALAWTIPLPPSLVEPHVFLKPSLRPCINLETCLGFVLLISQKAYKGMFRFWGLTLYEGFCFKVYLWIICTRPCVGKTLLIMRRYELWRFEGELN